MLLPLYVCAGERQGANRCGSNAWHFIGDGFRPPANKSHSFRWPRLATIFHEWRTSAGHVGEWTAPIDMNQQSSEWSRRLCIHILERFLFWSHHEQSGCWWYILFLSSLTCKSSRGNDHPDIRFSFSFSNHSFSTWSTSKSTENYYRSSSMAGLLYHLSCDKQTMLTDVLSWRKLCPNSIIRTSKCVQSKISKI